MFHISFDSCIFYLPGRQSAYVRALKILASVVYLILPNSFVH